MSSSGCLAACNDLYKDGAGGVGSPHEPVREEDPMRLTGIEQDFKAIWHARMGDSQIGHAHFWDRAFSRRQVLARAAGVAGATVASPFVLPGLARAGAPGLGEPRPIP